MFCTNSAVQSAIACTLPPFFHRFIIGYYKNENNKRINKQTSQLQVFIHLSSDMHIEFRKMFHSVRSDNCFSFFIRSFFYLWCIGKPEFHMDGTCIAIIFCSFLWSFMLLLSSFPLLQTVTLQCIEVLISIKIIRVLGKQVFLKFLFELAFFLVELVKWWHVLPFRSLTSACTSPFSNINVYKH